MSLCHLLKPLVVSNIRDKNLTDSCSLEDPTLSLSVAMEISCFTSLSTLSPLLSDSGRPLPISMEMIPCTPTFLPSHILAPQTVTIETECPSSPVISMVTLLGLSTLRISPGSLYARVLELWLCVVRGRGKEMGWLPAVAAVLSVCPNCEGTALLLPAKGVRNLLA